jgi:Fe-S-cluster containining protein
MQKSKLSSFPDGCRMGCAACCIAPSISSKLPGMPEGKEAGVRCVHLASDLRCELFGRPERPAVCTSLKPSAEMCGASQEEATAYIEHLERITGPTAPKS